MPKKANNTFFLGLIKKDGTVIGHAASNDATTLSAKTHKESPKDTSVRAQALLHSDFHSVFREFVTVMESYRKFIPITLRFAPIMAASMADIYIGAFARAKGKERPELSTEELSVYELDTNCSREFNILHDQVVSAVEGTKRIPEIMVIGLISSYDAFLTKLLKVILGKHSDIFFTSDRSISFSDLSKFASMEEAKLSLIDKEVENIIRASHHEHFSWMENRLKMKLREGLDVWPRFIEICERRNLLTHNGGHASNQYINNCREHKVDISNINIGDRLPVDSKYFSNAVAVIYEVGVKLCYVLWRKFAKQDSAKADTTVNELAFDLIHDRAYELAEAILRFGVEGFKGERVENTLCMMTINLANAIRLQGRENEAKSLIRSKDWSAVDKSLKLGVAAVLNDVDEVAKLMVDIGNTGKNAEHYRTWPVFRGLQNEKLFVDTFETIFEEPLILTKEASLSIASQPIEFIAPESDIPTPTKH